MNAVLVFLLMRRLTGSFWTSAFSAALFAWHPLRVESVSWISERKDVMSGFFFLLTIWAYAAYAGRRVRRERAWPLYGVTLVLFLGGLMCKPMLVTLPLLLLALDFWPCGAHCDGASFLRKSCRSSRCRRPFQSSPSSCRPRNPRSCSSCPFWARVENAFVSLVRYTGKFLCPFGLTALYPHPGYWPAWLVGASVLAVGAATALAWRQRSARPWVPVGLFWFLVVMLPAIGLVQVGFQSMADRYTYLPILGLQLAVLWTLRDLEFVRAHRAVTGFAACLVLTACAVRTWDQESTWKDPITFYRHALEVTQSNDTAHALLGYTLGGMGRFEEAGDESRLALKINPRKRETALIALARRLMRRKGASTKKPRPRAAPSFRSIRAIPGSNSRSACCF